jgi:hypothetical protein
MQCIHPTTQSGRAFSALATDGLAPDDAVERLAEVVGYRLHISLGEVSCQCGDPSTLTLVALAPDDPSLPAAARSSLADLRPGTAIAAAELTELVGGSVAVPGVDVRITSCADLGSSGVVAVTLDDAAAFLRAGGGERPAVTTTVVLAAVHGPLDPPEGWRVVADGTSSVSLQPEHIGHAEQERAA